MKSFKFWFILIMTFLSVISIFLLIDVIVAGILGLVVMFWDKVLAEDVFRGVIIALLVFEVPLTTLTAINYYCEHKEGED